MKHDIAYAGIAERTDWRRTCFPAPDKNLVVQLITLYLIRYKMELKMSRFLLPKCSGSPRYFLIPPSFYIVSWRLTRSFVWEDVLEEKVIADLVAFMHWPDAFSYLLRRDTSCTQLWASDLMKNIVSSAKSRWFIAGLFRATLTPVSKPRFCALVHIPERTSVHRIKRYGESGSPFRRPWEGET